MTDGFCRCGCGERTPLATQTRTQWGYKKGEPVPYIHGHNRRLSPVAYREEDRGYTTPCWIWQRSGNARGYGQIHDGTRLRVAHEVWYERRYGPVPEGLQLDHLCRQRSCVNPDHLEQVSGAVNVRRGTCTKLTEDSVRAIRASTGKQRDLARQFGVNQATIWAIRHRVTWKDVH